MTHTIYILILWAAIIAVVEIARRWSHRGHGEDKIPSRNRNSEMACPHTPGTMGLVGVKDLYISPFSRWLALLVLG